MFLVIIDFTNLEYLWVNLKRTFWGLSCLYQICQDAVIYEGRESESFVLCQLWRNVQKMAGYRVIATFDSNQMIAFLKWILRMAKPVFLPVYYYKEVIDFFGVQELSSLDYNTSQISDSFRHHRWPEGLVSTTFGRQWFCKVLQPLSNT